MSGFLLKSIESKTLPYKTFRALFFIIICTFAFLNISKQFELAGRSDRVVSRDISQLYVMGKAYSEGISCYLPIPELSKKFLGGFNDEINQHPSPYPPTTVLLIFPLTKIFTPQIFNQFWVLFSVICIFAAIFLFLFGSCSKPFLYSCLWIGALITFSTASSYDLFFGQLNSQCLLIISVFWKFYKRGDFVLAGVFLCLCIILKPLYWMLIPYFILKKKWKLVLTFFISSTLAIIITVLSFKGVDIFYDFIKSSSIANKYYIIHYSNNSIFYLFMHLIKVNQFVIQIFEDSVYLTFLDRLSYYNIYFVCLSVFLGIILSIFIFKRIISENSEDICFGKLLLFSPFVLPISWHHYILSSIFLIILYCKKKYLIDLKIKNALLILSLLVSVCYNFDFYAVKLILYYYEAGLPFEINLPLRVYRLIQPALLLYVCYSKMRVK